MKALLAILWLISSNSIAFDALTGQEAAKVAILAEVYDALREKLPPGQHAVLVDDDFKRPSPDRGQRQAVSEDASGVAEANRLFAGRAGLPVGGRARYLRCTTTLDCEFAEGVSATISLRVESLGRDEAVVEATTRHFLEVPNLRERFGIAHQAIAFWVVRLERVEGKWSVAHISQVGHS